MLDNVSAGIPIGIIVIGHQRKSSTNNNKDNLESN